MFPDRKTALQELAKAEELNPGPWGEHSRNVAHAAELIAGRCDKMDSDKAFVCGLLHDIGRRTGVAAVRHIIDGYDYAAARGWDEVAPSRILKPTSERRISAQRSTPSSGIS